MTRPLDLRGPLSSLPHSVLTTDGDSRGRGRWWWVVIVLMVAATAGFLLWQPVERAVSVSSVARTEGWSRTASHPTLAYKFTYHSEQVPTLLFVHGGPGDNSAYWMVPLESRWRTQWNLLWYDQRGAGKSERGLAYDAYSLAAHVEDIRRVQDAAGLERVVLVAHSWGGIPASLYAVRYPERVAALINVSGTGSFQEIGEHLLQHLKAYYRKDAVKLAEVKGIEQRPRGFESFIHRARLAREAGLYYKDFAKTKAEIGELLAAAVRRGEYTEDEVTEAEDALRFAMDYHSLDTADIMATLPQIKCPTLVIAGVHDKVVDVAHLQRYQRAIPGAELVLFERSGHHPFQEEPERFDDVVTAFIQQRVVAGRDVQ